MRSTIVGGSSPSASAADRRQAAGVDADADRDAALLRLRDDRLHLLGVADVAGVEAQAVEAGVDRGQRPAVVEVDVGDQRHRRLAHDLRQRVRGLLVGHGDAHDLAAELRELVDLAHGRGDVRRVGAASSTARRSGASPPIFTSPI